MKFLKKLIYPIQAFFNRKRMESEMEDEMQLHIEMQADEYMQQGLSEKEAILKAKKAFGKTSYVKEDCRASWGVRILDEWMNDFSFAIRQILKNKGFTSIALLSLVLGIGVNTALFSTLNGILLKKLPVEKPEQLREIQWIGPSINGSTSGTGYLTLDLPNPNKIKDIISYPLYQRLRNQAREIADIIAWKWVHTNKVKFGSHSFHASSMLVSDNFFEALKVQPVIGHQTIGDSSDLSNDGTYYAWLSHNTWICEFAQDSQIIGKNITIKGQSFTIAGIIPESFKSLEKGKCPNIYLSLEAQPHLITYIKLHSPQHFWLQSMARLKHPAMEQTLQNVLTHAIIDEDIRFLKKENDPDIRAMLLDASRGITGNNKQSFDPFKIPFIMSGILFLVCCINLGGLQFARGSRRVHELSIRAALGAKRNRLIRQILCESILICFIGTLIGFIVGFASRVTLSSLFLGRIKYYDTSLDVRIILSAIAISAACSVIIGLLPALWVTRQKSNLHINHRTTASAVSVRIGKAAISIQIVFAIVLAVAAGLFTRTLIHLTLKEIGFQKENLLMFTVGHAQSPLAPDTDHSVLSKKENLLRAIPGVKDVSLANIRLLANNSRSSHIRQADFPQPVADDVKCYYIAASSSFFNTLGIKMIAGSTFPSDINCEGVKQIVINESLASQAYPNENPLGKILKFNNKNHTIIGVCNDIYYRDLKNKPKNIIILHLSQERQGMMDFGDHYYVRTHTDPLILSNTISEVLKNEVPSQSIMNIRTMEMSINRLVRPERNVTFLSIIFASITILLTCIGLFALMSYDVNRRTQELGIRMAFGAKQQNIFKSILRNALHSILPGLIVGIPFSILLMRLIKDKFHGVSVFDLPSLITVISFIIATTLLAVIIPAFRSSRLDPAVVLRNE